MITAEYCRMMARYNLWQNGSLRSGVAGLGSEAVRAGRGAFFGSIFGTANHLLWADAIWMSRFTDCAAPTCGIKGSVEYTPDRAAWDTARAAQDDAICVWADGLDDTALAGELSWFSGALGTHITKPLALCVAHFFNHQTHHRGQLHAMLTQAGWSPDDTDLFIMPTQDQES
ncbi:MAG: DinB family protein [Pseudomonadota bacterium]